ncbi:MAG: universal stress protein, partial [Verrucomicrobiota bacterium]
GLTKQKSQTGFKSIIVPIDFSETSIKSLDYALALARESGSQINLVHVLEFPAVFNSTAQPSYAIFDKEAKRLATARLAALVDEKIDEWTTVNFEVRFGRAYKAICETAKEQKTDLIVIGTHGFTGLKHLLLGSTAERVIRHAPCTVLTVCKQQIRNVKFVVQPKKILVPTDFSKSADAALQAAALLAKQYQAQIHLLHVVPNHDAVGEYYKIDRQLLESGEMEACQKKLAALSKTLLAKKISFKIEIRRGRPAVEITQVSEELDADLIAISTHGRTGWQHALLGSVTEEVVRHSLCPVLVVRKNETRQPKTSDANPDYRKKNYEIRNSSTK